METNQSTYYYWRTLVFVGLALFLLSPGAAAMVAGRPGTTNFIGNILFASGGALAACIFVSAFHEEWAGFTLASHFLFPILLPCSGYDESAMTMLLLGVGVGIIAGYLISQVVDQFRILALQLNRMLT